MSPDLLSVKDIRSTEFVLQLTGRSAEVLDWDPKVIVTPVVVLLCSETKQPILVEHLRADEAEIGNG